MKKNTLITSFALLFFAAFCSYANPMLFRTYQDYGILINSNTQEISMITLADDAAFKVTYMNNTGNSFAALVIGECNKTLIGTTGYKFSINGDTYNATHEDCTGGGKNVFKFYPNQRALEHAIKGRTFTVNYTSGSQTNSVTFSAMGFTKAYKKYMELTN